MKFCIKDCKTLFHYSPLNKPVGNLALSALVPSTALQASPATSANAAVRRSGPSVALLSEDTRNGTRPRTKFGEADRPRIETSLPGDQAKEVGGGSHRRRFTDQPAFWPTSTYFTQQLSQEVLRDDRPGVDAGTAAARYPSLALEVDVIEPNQAFAAPTAELQRVDIVV